MDAVSFYNIVDKQGLLTLPERDDLKKIIDEYPYFQTAMFCYLKSLYVSDDSSFGSELERLSIFINDRKALFYHIMSNEYDKFFRESGKKEIGEDKTSILLNAFFDTRENDDDSLGLEFSISHSSLATTDYFSYLEMGASGISIPPEEEETPLANTALKHQDIIDSFIEKSEEEGGVRIQISKENIKDAPDLPVNDDEAGDELDDDLFFTETLSKIYIKQKKYEKAYKIIEHLSLNYPKKNTYFADQLSFLEKLIINSKFKNIK